MSKVEYNSLLLRISERLDEINALNRILFICREKLAGEDIHDSLSMLTKLEQKGFLGVDELQEVKDILKAVEEWSLREEIIKFESMRGEYKELIERVIDVLEDLDDLERLMSTVCRVKRIPEERKNDIHDLRSLFQVLEDMGFLGIDRLGILREILTELRNHELLTELAEFQKRRVEYETHERRKALGAAVLSSARTATQRIIGEIRVHCTFRTLRGVLLVVGPGVILRRSSTLMEYIQVFRDVILPAAIELRAISEGSVCFMVQAETSLALEELYERYSTGRLQRDLQEFLVTDDIRQLANGEEVVVSVHIDENEYREALDDLTNVNQEGRDDIEEKQSRYLNEERMAFVQNYLENTEDTSSLTTGTSDDGIGTHSASSDLASEEPSEFPSEPCLKDLSEETITELTCRLRSDEVSCNQFYYSFGLENRHPRKMLGEIGNIDKLFPDTPIKLVLDVCQALQLHDLVELLEKAAKPRTLRAALPLKEIAKLPSDSKRPTTFYSKVKIVFVGDGEETFDTMRNFFKKICPGSKIFISKPHFDFSFRQFLVSKQLDVKKGQILTQIKVMEEYEEAGEMFVSSFATTNVKFELEKRKNEIEKQLSQVNGELQEKKKIVAADISSAFDRSWGEERDDKSTLFVAFQVLNLKRGTRSYSRYTDYRDPIPGIMMEKLTSFPTAPKLVVTPTWNTHPSKELGEIPESLHVEYEGGEVVVSSILEVLSKRWQTVDLISIMKEVQRTLWRYGANKITKIADNLSTIPRFQSTPEQS
ncbi:PREDICTED: uncharacterized protein LOC107332373 isoform X3 [Acropora digitifera]|uniref:uncharacterized protein LOC107332373 isoform X3 n=1 Tax=Acropora digitifera TaxID=70779 RepID=UPI00077A215C|nr:PREDICTED: uncharacterized protein LOC107332373 isoform X3 [Acropora digitifera]